jgi:rod shape-determining protein MreB
MFQKIIDLFRLPFFSYDLGVDLGTANTLIAVKGKGVVVREPSVVAREKQSGRILAVGVEAKKMIGKTPAFIEAIRPLKDGVIADFDACEALLKQLIGRTLNHTSRWGAPPPRMKVVIGIPSGVTEVERRAVQDAALSAGAKQAYLVEEPLAAAVGIGLPIEEAQGQMVIDIGGGTTEIAILSLAGIVIDRCLRVAGDEMDETIVNFMRIKHNLVIGQTTAEDVKQAIGSAIPFPQEKKFVVRGRDMAKGLPRSVKLSSDEIREAIGSVIQEIEAAVHDVLEETPPELLADIVSKGIVLSGGGSQIYGLDKLISENTKIPVWIADDPLTAVVRGCEKLLDHDRLLEKVRIKEGLK